MMTIQTLRDTHVIIHTMHTATCYCNPEGEQQTFITSSDNVNTCMEMIEEYLKRQGFTGASMWWIAIPDSSGTDLNLEVWGLNIKIASVYVSIH